MSITVFIGSHERWEALDAYGDRLSETQKEQIKDSPDGALIRLQLWPEKSHVTIIEE
jgi:hypothetical protein